MKRIDNGDKRDPATRRLPLCLDTHDEGASFRNGIRSGLLEREYDGDSDGHR